MWFINCFHYCKDLKILIKPVNQFRYFSYCNYLKRQSPVNSACFLKICFKYLPSNVNLLSCRFDHTAKGWKFLAKPRIIENDDDAIDPADAPCEEGTGAVPHNILIAELRECRTIEEQMCTLSSMLSLSVEDIANRHAFCEAFSDCLRPYFPAFKIHPFGSSMNGFGFKGCDLDVCLQTSFDGTVITHNPNFNIPTLDDVLNGTFNKADVIYLHPKLLMRFVRRILRKHFEGLKEPLLYIKARTPILRFYNEKFDIFCDFSAENKYAFKNTKILRFFSHLDPRIPELVKTVRYWGKHGKFVGDIERFNSYACSLLVLYFLQNTNPPILPPFGSLVESIDYLKSDGPLDDDAMFESLKTVTRSTNTQTTGELLRDFFFFYLYYDFSHVMLPWTSYSLSKQDFKLTDTADTFELSTICIDDPFRQFFNQTFGVEYKYCKRFLTSLIQACKLFQNPNLLYPNQGDWGLISLFESTMDDSTKVIEAKKATEFEIFLQSAEDGRSVEELYKSVTQHIKYIFEYVFLFNCNSVPIRQVAKNLENPILKLRCEVKHNTWIGRRLAEREHFADVPHEKPMELEHMISTHLAKQRQSTQVLFRFICTCFAVQKNDRAMLKMNIILESGKMPPNVTIFLQDYVQKLLNHVL